MVNVDAIVAGAGIWGCTVARRLAEGGCGQDWFRMWAVDD